MSNGGPPESDGLTVSRRRLLTWLNLGFGTLAAAVVSVPILSYLLSPLLNMQQTWVRLGPIGQFQVGATQQVAYEDPAPVSWAGQTARTAVWVRRASDADFTVFAVNCTHLGCPVNWLAQANLFMCPCHGGVYYADGTVAGGPPPRPLFRYQTRIQDGNLEILSRPLPLA
jgi:menaquinol-cytochrome c reductase iron-sulfur subunit